MENFSMRWRAISYRGVFLWTVVVAMLCAPSSVWAQDEGLAGVVVDAQGVLQKRVYADPGGQLMRQRIAAAKASVNPKVTAFSKLRKVSLNRLEQAIRDKGGVPSDEMRYLAGLLRVRNVFFYPDSKDIVIAGPAEGWVEDLAGRVVGISSRRPAIQLQDLVVALRAFPPGGEGTQLIGCSIDPTAEGLAAMQDFLRSAGRNFPAGSEQVVAARMTDGLRASLGLQKVRVNGVSPQTHFAQVLVEADYRMKLIGIGLEQPPVRMVSFVDRAQPSQVSRNALFRWYFVPDYQCVRLSEDSLAMELVGDGVKLVGEDEMVSSGGQRTGAGRASKASQMFTLSFTKNYSALADRSPVYAELRNLIDLAVAAAHVQQQNLYAKAGWKMDYFGNEKEFSVQTYNAPQQVESAVAAVLRGSQLMTPIGGGVHIDALMALKPENVMADEKGSVAKLRDQLKPELPKGQWWWD
jgi:hypothetical protein